MDKFRNGYTISEASTDEEWKLAGKNGKPAWCYYDNNPENGKVYGKIYNWFAVNDPRGLAPKGFHIPTDQEWTALEDVLGEDPGKILKSEYTPSCNSESYIIVIKKFFLNIYRIWIKLRKNK